MAKNLHSLAYVSPSFPATPLVFEQNEILGLVELGVDVTILSCRRSPSAILHSFAQQLVPLTRYFSASHFLLGLVRLATRHPICLLSVMWCVIKAIISQPGRVSKYVGSFALAVSFYQDGCRQKWQWIHADFSQGSATTAWFLSQFLNIPFSSLSHAFDIYSNKPGVRESPGFYAQKMKQSRLIFVEHEFGAKILQQQLPFDIQDKLQIQRLSVRTNEISAMPFPNSIRDGYILALGTLVEKKGFDLLVRAIQILVQDGADLRCAIWGDGPEREYLQSLIADYDLESRIQLHGAYNQDKLAEILRGSLFLVMPSRVDSWGDIDGTPTVLFEAMSAARPVVSTDVSGIPEVVKNGFNGTIVPQNDSQKLSAAIFEFVKDLEHARQLGVNARSYCERSHSHLVVSQNLIDQISACL